MKGIFFQALGEAKETMRKKCAFFCYKRKHTEGEFRVTALHILL